MQAALQAGLAAGLVDYKICSIDETWSALKFTRRKLSKKRMGCEHPRNPSFFSNFSFLRSGCLQVALDLPIGNSHTGFFNL